MDKKISHSANNNFDLKLYFCKNKPNNNVCRRTIAPTTHKCMFYYQDYNHQAQGRVDDYKPNIA